MVALLAAGACERPAEVDGVPRDGNCRDRHIPAADKRRVPRRRRAVSGIQSSRPVAHDTADRIERSSGVKRCARRGERLHANLVSKRGALGVWVPRRRAATRASQTRKDVPLLAADPREVSSDIDRRADNPQPADPVVRVRIPAGRACVRFPEGSNPRALAPANPRKHTTRVNRVAGYRKGLNRSVATRTPVARPAAGRLERGDVLAALAADTDEGAAGVERVTGQRDRVDRSPRICSPCRRTPV